MSQVQLIYSLANAENIHKASLFSLKPGLLVFGKVEKFLQNDTAIVRVGNVRLVAHMQAALSDADRYWFEVRSSGNEGIELKVVEGIGENDSAQLFLKSLHLPETNRTMQLVEFFLSKNLPFSKERLQAAASWINPRSDSSKEFAALEWMLKKDLPFTKQIFQSLMAVIEPESFYQQLAEVNRYLDQPSFSSFKSIQELKQLITSIINNHSINELGNGTEVKKMLKTLVQSLGLGYEKEVQMWANGGQDSSEPISSLKPLLMRAMTELECGGKELEPILHRLTGMQLISQDPTGQVQQMVMQLPLSFGDKNSDITLQWRGRKNSKGQIDPDYCRIIFYLDLQSMNETVVDMHIQNKVIHLSVMNDTKGIESIVKAFTPKLKEKLSNIGYTLSFIKVNPFVEKNKVKQRQRNPIELSVELSQRVDIKV
ncbi:hypothetical protein V7150_16430 [Neobacillus drentensis]|uniref:hypothetical protein n=1 Tax=Neobacillus drentensis TaxID=220684 RepID=UPI002FFECC3C